MHDGWYLGMKVLQPLRCAKCLHATPAFHQHAHEGLAPHQQYASITGCRCTHQPQASLPCQLRPNSCILPGFLQDVPQRSPPAELCRMAVPDTQLGEGAMCATQHHKLHRWLTRQNQSWQAPTPPLLCTPQLKGAPLTMAGGLVHMPRMVAQLRCRSATSMPASCKRYARIQQNGNAAFQPGPIPPNACMQGMMQS